MKWTEEAQKEISRVPFFVRKRIKKRVEEEALGSGVKKVRLEHVKTCQRQFLDQMEDHVRGHQVEICFGQSGCPNRAVVCEDLSQRLEENLSRRDLRSFLKERVKGTLKVHHNFRISVSDCPNACSRPQIADIGLIGARSPQVTGEVCKHCGACTEVCQEEAISFQVDQPVVNNVRCVSCGQCLTVCPTGTLQEAARGYRILVGGKLGRHPRLATELPGIYRPKDTLNLLDRCIDHYQENCFAGERFGEVLNRTGLNWLLGKRKNDQ